MSADIIDGPALAKEQFSLLRERITKLGKPPTLTVVTTAHGGDSAFVRAKRRAGESIGLVVDVVYVEEDISVAAFRRSLNDIVHTSHSDGIVVQLPLPDQLDQNRHALLRVLPDQLDVDCLSERWLGRMLTGRTTIHFKNASATLLPPVAAAVKYILESKNVPLLGARVLVVGWGDLVGKPVAIWLLAQGATVSVVTTSEKDLPEIARTADIIVSGAGQPGLITGDMVRDGATVLDAGTSGAAGVLVGDVDRESVASRAGILSPSPGGIGPLTLAALFTNIVALTEARRA